MDLTKVLQYIPASSLDYQEWVNVGMALKHEGYSCDVWDAWSAADSRYKAGECSRKWQTFREGTTNIVTGGTIYELATRYGYTPQGRDIKTFEWDDEIEYDGDQDVIIKDAAWLETSLEIKTPDTVGPDDLRRFIQALFKPDDIVGFCVDAALDEEKNKWKPCSKGSYGMTAKQLLASIKKHPDDITLTIGDYNKEAGAWIRFNPMDGEGVQNANVTDLRYALVESDDMEIEKQKALIDELRLPVAVMSHSGGKSIHAIVKIDAVTEQDYREKVDYLYRVCEKNGLSIDKVNKNPSRLTRMPGVLRGDKKQFIIAENIGCKNFDEWKEYIEDSIDNLPEIVSFSDLSDLPPLSPELIEGVLRKGHKMLISGASKAGKSFLLIELAIRISTGGKWLGFQCAKGKVLYVNLEVDKASFLHRIADVQAKMGIKDAPSIDVWNLRGENAAIDKLTPRLIHRARNKDYAAIILDPLYKINLGDENSASEMAKFFNQLDMICTKLNTSIICCHHHSKGAQGGKFSIDRASGSGVFARDPDAVLDMIQLNPRDAGFSLEDKSDTAWRVSATLREFKTPEPVDVIFHYPLHEITEDLKDAKPMSGQDSSTNSKRGNDVKAGKMHEKYERLLAFVENWDEIDTKQPKSQHPTLAEAVEYFKTDSGYSERSIRRWIENNTEAVIQNGLIILNDQEAAE